MTHVSDAEQTDFFAAIEEASKKAIWCAIATAGPDGPRVRIVHPTWEGRSLWFATGTTSPKIAQIRHQPAVGDVIDYDLSQFWPGGPTDPNYSPVRIDPERVELSKMFGTADKRVWRHG
jgi:general stress protein 26